MDKEKQSNGEVQKTHNQILTKTYKWDIYLGILLTIFAVLFLIEKIIKNRLIDCFKK